VEVGPENGNVIIKPLIGAAEFKRELTVTDLFQSVEDRDGMFKSGMKEGATESMDRLEEIVLKTLKAQ